MMHTPRTPSSMAPPVLSGKSGFVTSISRSVRSSFTDSHGPGESISRNARPANPIIEPSSAFSTTLPVKPSVTTTSARDDMRSRPSTFPTNPFIPERSSWARLRNASPFPASSPLESNPTVGNSVTLATRAYAREERPSSIHSGSGSTVAPESTSNWIGRRPTSATEPHRRAVHAFDPVPPRSAAAIVAGIARADHGGGPAIAHRFRAPDQRSVLARAHGVGGVVVHRDDPARRAPRHAGATPPGRCSAIASGCPTSRMSTSHSSTAASARRSRRARSPPIASTAITGAAVTSSPFSSVDVDSLMTSVPTAVAAHGVRSARAAVRAQ